MKHLKEGIKSPVDIKEKMGNQYPLGKLLFDNIFAFDVFDKISLIRAMVTDESEAEVYFL